MGEHQNFKLRKLKAAIDRIALLVNSNAAMKKLRSRLVRQLTAQFDKKLSHAKAEREHRVKQQDSKLRKMMVAIDRIGSHVNYNTALRKLQNEEKSIQKQLTHLRRAERIETLERNKRVRSAMAALKKEHRETSKQVISLARRLDMHVHLDHALQRAQFKEELSRAKVEGEHRVEHQNFKLRKLKAAIDRIALLVNSNAAMKKLRSRLVRQLTAQFDKKLSHAKAEREHRVNQQDSKLRKMMVAIDRIGSHVNSNTALRKLQ